MFCSFNADELIMLLWKEKKNLNFDRHTHIFFYAIYIHINHKQYEQIHTVHHLG